MKRTKRKWLLLSVVAVIVIAIVVSRTSEPTIEEGSYLLVDVEGAYAEGRPASFFTQLIEERDALVDLLDGLVKAAHDERIAGVVVRVGALSAGWAQTREIREALVDVKQRGKRVIAFLGAEVFGGNKEYYLASVADQVYLAPAGSPMLNGLSAHYYFLGGLWEKLHVAMEVEQIREFKTFGDMLARRSMSAAHREMANSILDEINGEFLGAIADARGLSVEEMQSIVDSCPSSASDFVEAGLADGIVFFDELTAEVAGRDAASSDEAAEPALPIVLVEASEYAGVSRRSLGLGGGPKVAIIHAVGTIVPGEGGRRSAFGMTVGSRTLTEAFRQAADDQEIRAIVFRVDSPGGSASASDAVWHAIRVARERKPVVASFADVAASGGYYMASGADHIVAEPVSLTGSIGVVLFKPNVAGLLGWLGIGSQSLTRGRYAGLLDTSKGLDRAEAALLRAQMDGVYRRFLDRVAEGRSMTVEEVDKVGGGRVWTGSQALKAGLIDEIGGLRQAVRAAAVEAGIDEPDNVELVYLPEAKSFLAQLATMQQSRIDAMIPAVLARHLAGLRSHAMLDAGIYTLTAGMLKIQ